MIINIHAMCVCVYTYIHIYVYPRSAKVCNTSEIYAHAIKIHIFF